MFLLVAHFRTGQSAAGRAGPAAAGAAVAPGVAVSLTDTAPPAVTDTAPPAMTDTAPPAMTDTAPPAVTDAAPPQALLPPEAPVPPEALLPPEAAEPLTLLAASPECMRLRFARSTEVPGRFVLVAEFASAAQYRRALSPWPIRTVVVPWLSTAEVDTSEVHEVLLQSEQGLLTSSAPTVTPPGR